MIKRTEDINEMVSVVIPAYNHERFIVDCLESVKDQTYKEIELIVCDDNSHDATYRLAVDWCRQNQNRFVNCCILKNDTNQGVTKNINRMVELAKGDYIKILASDDMLLPNGINDLVLVMRREHCDLVYANAIKIKADTGKAVQDEDKMGFVFRKAPKYGAHPFEELYDWNFIPAFTVLLRRDCITKYGKFSETSTYEDWEYWLRMASRGASFCYANSTVAYYRINEKSASHFMRTEEEKKRFVLIVSELEEMLQEYACYTSKNMDGFWNNTLSTALHQHNDLVIKECIDKASHIRFFQRIKLLLYRMNLYDITIEKIKYLQNYFEK